EGDRSKPSNRMLILSVIVHCPYLFGTRARADKVNLRFSNAVNAAAQPQDNLVGKAMSNRPRHLLARRLVVLASQNLRVRCICRIEEPSVNDDLSAGNRKRAKSHHLCAC